jgi:hypothetical protein
VSADGTGARALTRQNQFAFHQNWHTIAECGPPGALKGDTMSKKGSLKSSDSRKAAEPTRQEPVSVPGTTAKGPIDPADKLKFEDLGTLPAGYGDMFLIARDPHWLFSYWDFDYSSFPTPRKLFLEVYRGDELESTIEINEVARNWYIPVKAAASPYTVAFGYRDANDERTVVGKAGATQTPPESISSNWETQFATVPFHLSFNFLLDVISSAQSAGQRLAETLGLLQQAAIGSTEGVSSWGGEQVKVLETLLGKNLLDRLFSMSSQEVLEFLHAEMSGRLDSESASELLAKGRLASLLAPGESSLFSGSIREFVRQELSSAGVSSFGAAEVGGVSSALGGLSSEVLAGGSETLASWQVGVSSIISKWERALLTLGLGSEVLASWRAGLSEIASSFSSAISSYGLSSESLASWQAGVGEIFGKWESILSSYGVSSQMLASWETGLTEITSSWGALVSSYGLSSAVLSSWETAFSSYGVSSYSVSSYSIGSAIASEQLSSWNLSSWSGVEFGPSSWSGLEFGASSWSGLEFGPSSWSALVSETSLSSGFGASWSAQPFGGREFFMHVNAEVIFYGGTDPQAKVTIAGRPVQLQPDGTFRYHFVFPDNNFEIPIVAVSPDGVETRSAVLFLNRDTNRYGEVGATAQPKELETPMGQRN